MNDVNHHHIAHPEKQVQMLSSIGGDTRPDGIKTGKAVAWVGHQSEPIQILSQGHVEDD
jgi:hypothetical protein